LKETILASGSMVVHGSTCMVEQEPFILKATLRENITFGTAFDQDKFESILEATGLREDLENISD